MLFGAKKKNNVHVPKQENIVRVKSRKAFSLYLPLVFGIIYVIKSVFFPPNVNAQEKADTFFFNAKPDTLLFDGSKVHVITSYQDTVINFSKLLLNEFGYSKFPESVSYVKICFGKGKPAEFDIYAPYSRVISIFVHSETGRYTSGNVGISLLPNNPQYFEITVDSTKGLYFFTPKSILISLPDGGFELPVSAINAALGLEVYKKIRSDATLVLGYDSVWSKNCLELKNQPDVPGILHFEVPTVSDPKVKAHYYFRSN